MGRNPKKLLLGCNTTRPGGASALATGDYPPNLIHAALTGNRATRRLARKNLFRVMRKDLGKH